jgi:peptidoglycan/LPS O-acetylase OafA/YrhL
LINMGLLNLFFGPGGYRLLLALIVVVHHISRINFGEFAVYAFFNLSGFWMASVWRDKYSTEGGGYSTFILARLLRLLPLFLLANALGILVDILTHRFGGKVGFEGVGVMEVVHYAFSNLFILGYNFLPYKGLIPAWSLDVEMQYYLALPALFLLVQRTRWLGLVGLLGLFAMVKDTALQESLLGYAMFFYMGMLACVYRWQPNAGWLRGSWLMAASLLVLLLGTSEGRSMVIGGSTRAADFEVLNRYVSALLALVCMPITIASTWLPSSRRDKVLGDLSYSVYIFHSPLAVAYGYWCGQMAPMQRAPYLLAYLAVTAVVSCAAWRWVDKPVMAMRSRYLARAMGARPAASALKAA